MGKHKTVILREAKNLFNTLSLLEVEILRFAQDDGMGVVFWRPQAFPKQELAKRVDETETLARI